MIAITILPYETQFVRAVKRKNKIKIVNSYSELDPILDAIRDGDYDSIYSVLQEVVELTKNKNEEYFIVIPDTEFQIGTEDYAEYKNETLENNIDFLRVNDIKADEKYFSFPMQMKTSSQWLRSYYAIDKSKIDILIKVAKDLNMVIKNIEPLSIAYMRYLRMGSDQVYFLEFNNDFMELIFFNPISGMYKFQIENISLEDAKRANKNEIHEILDKEIEVAHSYFLNTIHYVNPNQKIVVVASPDIQNKLAYPSKENEFIKINLVHMDDIVEKNEPEFAIGIGSLLQSLSVTNESDFYNLFKHTYILNTNLLPNSFIKQNTLLQDSNTIKRKAKIIAIALACLSVFEMGATVNFNSVSIPDKLQSDFDIANAKIKALENEKKTIEDANATNEHPVEILSNLLAQKPDNQAVGFTDFEISAQEGKRQTDWIKLGLISNDSLQIKEYVDRLSTNEMFGTVNVSSIDNNQNGAKAAEITILRPGQEEQQAKSKAKLANENKDKEKTNEAK